MKTIEDLTDDLAIAHEEAKVWLERRADADKERMIAHVRYMDACRDIDAAERNLIIARGESS